jgi:hypothetical protein
MSTAFFYPFSDLIMIDQNSVGGFRWHMTSPVGHSQSVMLTD